MMRTTRKPGFYTLFISILMCLSTSTLACSIPPAGLYDDNYKLVRSAKSIVLATAVSYRIVEHEYASEMIFKFKAKETLKGSAQETFELTGYLESERNNSPGDFQAHQQPEFWAFGAGNSIMPGDCGAYGIFEVGQDYLVIERDAPHPRAYEKIQSSEDLWLKVIRVLVEEVQE